MEKAGCCSTVRRVENLSLRADSHDVRSGYVKRLWGGLPLPLPLGEVATRSVDGEGRHVKKICRCRHVKKICQWHIFSVDLSGYAAVASFLVCTAPSWIPSQSPTVTALPRGEPRAARCGHCALRNYPNTSFVSPSPRLRRHTSTFHFYRVPLLCKRKKPATQAFFFCSVCQKTMQTSLFLL